MLIRNPSRRILFTLLLMCAIFSTSAASLPEDFPAENNPHAHWTLGFLSQDMKTFKPYTQIHKDSKLVNYWFFEHWPRNGWIGKVFAATRVKDMHVEANQVFLVGSYENPVTRRQFTAVAWTAPETQRYTVKVCFSAQNIKGSDSCVFVVKKVKDELKYLNPTGGAGEPVKGFAGTASEHFKDAFGEPGKYQMNQEIELVKGDILYFAVLNTIPESRADFIGLQATIEGIP